MSDDDPEFDESMAFSDSIAARVDACANVLAEIKDATDPEIKAAGLKVVDATLETFKKKSKADLRSFPGGKGPKAS